MNRPAWAASAVCGLTLMAGSALAHATLEPPRAALNRTYEGSVRISHGCDGSATREVRLALSEGFIAAKPMPKPGWRIELLDGPYAQSYEHHGTLHREGVREIRWGGGPLADEHYDVFAFRGTFAAGDAGQAVAFPLTQVCEAGEVAWTEIPEPGGDARAPKHPAPGVVLGEEGTAPPGLTVEGAYARATPGGVKVAGGYLRVTNHGSVPDRLVGGSASFASRVEIHTMRMDQGVMRMRPLPQGIVIEPGQTVELKPGAEHLMFMDIDRPLRAGERRRMTLIFDRAGSLEFEIPVRALGAESPEPSGQTHRH